MVYVGIAAALSLAGAMGLLTLFFATRNERYDRLAEALFVVFGVLQLPVIVAVRADSQSALAYVSMGLGLAGAGGMAIGELLSLLRLIDFRRIAGLLTLAFIAFLAWIGLTSVDLLGSPLYPPALAWLGIASIAAGMLIMAWIVLTPGVIRGDREPGRWQMLTFFAPTTGIVAWMLWLSTLL
jgi:hypothetical protein